MEDIDVRNMPNANVTVYIDGTIYGPATIAQLLHAASQSVEETVALQGSCGNRPVLTVERARTKPIFEEANNRKSVKKRAATAGRFRIIERMAQMARLASHSLVKKGLSLKLKYFQ